MRANVTGPEATSSSIRPGDDTRGGSKSQTPEDLFPHQPVADQSGGRLAFLVVLLCYAVVDYARLQWVPLGPDTGHPWQVFYASYVELFFNHDLPHWFPYGLYGQPNTVYSLMDVTATDYLLMAVGKLLHIPNAVLLFQLSLMTDHVLFLFGIHLLARSFFQRRSSVWLCLIASIAVLHGYQLGWIQVFRIQAWYPLILYQLVRFFRDQQAEALWIAGILFTCACLGMAYDQPYVLMGVLPFVVVGSFKCPGAWRGLLSRRAGNWIFMFGFAAIASLYLWMLLHVLEGIVPARPGRTGASGGVPVEEFVARGAHAFSEVLISLFSGQLFYIGLLPVGCVLWGLFRVRTWLFRTLLATIFLLTWFSIGGLFSLLFYYHVPFFSLLHHLEMGFWLLPVLLLLAAGVVWDLFVYSRGDWKLFLLLPVVIFFAVDFGLYCDDFPLLPEDVQFLYASWKATFFRASIYGGLVGLAWLLNLILGRMGRHGSEEARPFSRLRRLSAGALLAGLLVDVMLYSYCSGLPENQSQFSHRQKPAVLWERVQRTSPVYQACLVQPLTWQGERGEYPADDRRRVAMQTPSYFYTYAFAQFDPCYPEFPPRAVGTAMQKLLSLRDKEDPSLKTVLGCNAPKLRLMTKAVYVESEAEAMAEVRSRKDLADVLVVQLPADSPGPPLPRTPVLESPGSVDVIGFSANHIDIRAKVSVPTGAWLVYADTYDARWRAWVNGNSMPVLPAYVGLKAVWVPHGENFIQMKFAGWANLGTRVLALAGALCSFSLLLHCGICLVWGFPVTGGGRQQHALRPD